MQPIEKIAAIPVVTNVIRDVTFPRIQLKSTYSSEETTLEDTLDYRTRYIDGKKRGEFPGILHIFGVHFERNRPLGLGNITGWTGFMPIGFKAIHPAADFKQYLFDKYKCCAAAWITDDGFGVYALFKIPIVSNQKEFKDYFYGAAAEFEEFPGFDSSLEDPLSQIPFPMDLDIPTRENPETWTVKGRKLPRFEKIER